MQITKLASFKIALKTFFQMSVFLINLLLLLRLILLSMEFRLKTVFRQYLDNLKYINFLSERADLIKVFLRN